MFGSRHLPAALAVAALALAGPAWAAPPAGPATPKAVQAVIDCRKLDDAQQRLACYDTAATALETAEKSGDVVSLDREQRNTVRRQAFGFTLPSLSVFDRGEKPDEMNQVQDTVASASQGAGGRWVMAMQDGEVWRQTDDAELYPAPHAGSAVVIKKGMLGSYMMNIDRQPAIRVEREH